jgi:hypothetical protein
VRRGLKGAHRKSAGRWTRTGYKVWYNSDERARDCEVLHLLHGLCFINPASTRRKSRHLPRETCGTLCKSTGQRETEAERDAGVSRGRTT